MIKNQVSSVDVTYQTLGYLSGGAFLPALLQHEYIVALAAIIASVVFAYLYHLFGSPTLPEGTAPVVTMLPPDAEIVKPVFLPPSDSEQKNSTE